MVSVCLPSDALSQHLPSYLGFSYLGREASLHGCSSKAQPLLLTLDEVASPDLGRGVAPLGPPVPAQPPLLGRGVALLGPPAPAQLPLLGRGITPLGCPWLRAWGSSSWLLLCRRSLALSVVYLSLRTSSSIAIPDDITEQGKHSGNWWKRLVAGGIASRVPRTCAAPFDCLKVMMQDCCFLSAR